MDKMKFEKVFLFVFTFTVWMLGIMFLYAVDWRISVGVILVTASYRISDALKP